VLFQLPKVSPDQTNAIIKALKTFPRDSDRFFIPINANEKSARARSRKNVVRQSPLAEGAIDKPSTLTASKRFRNLMK
jgi:hypothetical protein